MSRKDVINYYIGVQSQYLEMRSDIRDLEQAVKEGRLPLEMLEGRVAEIERLKENYKRVSYIIFLLDEPNRKGKKEAYRRRNRLVYDYLANSDALYIRSENDDVLRELKKLIKETKENG